MDSKVHKWVFEQVLIYGGACGDDKKVEIEGFVDSDYAGCMNSIKSIF